MKLENGQSYLKIIFKANSTLIQIFRKEKSLETEWTREQKIEFLLAGEKELGLPYTRKYGNFSNVTDEELNDMVEELDWLWK